MKAKIIIKEDTFSEYLDFIYNSLHENMPKELKREARLLTGDEWDENSGFIAPRMTVSLFGEFNPNLFASGQEEEYWVIKNASRSLVQGGGNVSSLEAIYTGMRLHKHYDDDAMVWWEFAEDNEPDPALRVLGRDYSFYQETGIDPIARPEDARAQGAIKEGVKASSDTLFSHAADYVYNIMRKGNGDIPPKLI